MTKEKLLAKAEEYATRLYEGGTWYWEAARDGYMAGYRAAKRKPKEKK